MSVHTTVDEAQRRLRETINLPRIHERLSRDEQAFRQLCASMDILGDTAHAVGSYLSSPEETDLGRLYLLAYGLLQVLFVQQDAVRHAAEAVGLPYELPPGLSLNRDVRNDAIGHPTKRGGKNPESFGIVQVSLSHEGFTLYSFDWRKPDNFQPIRFRDMIDRQEAVVVGIDAIIAHLLAL